MPKQATVALLTISLSLAGLTLFYGFSNESLNSEQSQNNFALIESKITDEAIIPIPENIHLNLKKVLIGEKLFNDPKLSANGTISCATCHNLNLGGTDQLALSKGIHGQEGTLNAPSIFNAYFNFSQNWNGAAKDLKQQALQPLFSAHEMGNKNWDNILQYLNSDSEYQLLFKNDYALPITSESFLDALVEFEKSLTTPNSRFDQYLKGNTSALNNVELAGFQLFQSRGCISCHQGVNIGGNMFHKAGIFEPIVSATSSEPLGRYSITHNENDKGVLKVPSLRNIALTAPYFHDGSVDSLEKAIQTMGRSQLGTDFSEDEIHKIALFLNTLTGEYKNQPL